MYQTVYKVGIETRIFIIISAIMLLPFLGGIKEIFTMPPSELTLLHYFCVFPYVLYGIWLWRMLSRAIIIGNEHVQVIDWISNRYHDYNKIMEIEEIEIPKKDIAHQRFAAYNPHIVIKSDVGRNMMNGYYIKKYPELKKDLEEKTKITIQTRRMEKTGLNKFFERITLTCGGPQKLDRYLR